MPRDVARSVAAIADMPFFVNEASIVCVVRSPLPRQSTREDSIMTAAQRWLLIASLTLIAIIMHWHWCEWSFGASDSGAILLGWRTQVPVGAMQTTADPRMPGLAEYNYYGCYTKYRTFGVFAGFVTPWVLLTAAAYLFLGRTRAARTQRGACLRCGYELNFKYHSGCPECGWNRSDAETSG